MSFGGPGCRWLFVTVASLVKADVDTVSVIPHLAKEFFWETSQTLVFVLREGTRW